MSCHGMRPRCSSASTSPSLTRTRRYGAHRRTPDSSAYADPSAFFLCQVLEYSCFQPGLLLDYLAGRYPEPAYLGAIETNMDFENRRFLLLEGRPGRYTMTSLRDMANIVARAVDYEGEWPTTGGIRGEDVTDVQLIELAAKIRGTVFPLLPSVFWESRLLWTRADVACDYRWPNQSDRAEGSRRARR